MAKKTTLKNAKTMNRKQMKKTTGGAYVGGVSIAVGDINGDNTAAFKPTLTRGT